MVIERLPTPPVFVWDPGDLFVFDTVADAESWLEPVDVRNGPNVAYDADGTRLTLGVHPAGRATRFRVAVARVTITCAEEHPSGQHELREILGRYLRSVGVSADEIHVESLSELQSIARRYAKR